MIKKGFTLVELLIVITIISILTGIIIVIIRPENYFKKGRDTKRFTYVNSLVQAIQEHRLDTGNYPDIANTVRQSNLLANGNTSLVDSTGSWIDADLSKYTSKMFIDPVNDDTYFIRYAHDSVGFEIDASLEAFVEEQLNTNDSGNNDSKYEVGSRLTILN